MSKFKFGAFLAGALLAVNSFAFAQEDTTVDTSEEQKVNMSVVSSRTQRRADETSADVTVITSEDLEERSGDSLENILRDFGISMDSNGAVTSEGRFGRQVRIRGFDTYGPLLIIDGQRVEPGNHHGFESLRSIPISQIERVEILKGSSSYLWGADAAAGVIYIQTKQGSGKEGFSGSFGSSYGNTIEGETNDGNVHDTTSYANVAYTWANGNRFWMGGTFQYRDLWGRPYNSIRDNGDSTYDVEEYTLQDELNSSFNVGALFNISDNKKLTLTAFYNQSESSIRLAPITSYTMDDDGNVIGEISEDGFRMGDVADKDLFVNAKFDWFVLDNLDLSLTTGVRYSYDKMFTGTYTLDGNVPEYSRVNYYNINQNLASTSEIFAAWYLNDIFTIKGGYNLTYEWYQNLRTSENGGAFNNALFAGADMAFKNIGGIDNLDVDITAGARGTVINYAGEYFQAKETLWDVSPEVGFVIKPGVDWMAVKGHVGHAYNAPTLSTSFNYDPDSEEAKSASIGWHYNGDNWSVSNPDLVPEEFWSFASSLEFYPLDGLALSVGGFYTLANNATETEYINDSSSSAYQTMIDAGYKEAGFHSDGNTLWTDGDYTGVATRSINVEGSFYYGFDLNLSYSKTFGNIGTFGLGYYFEQVWAYDDNEDLIVTFEDGNQDYLRLNGRPLYTMMGNISWSHADIGTMVRLSGSYYAPNVSYTEVSGEDYYQVTYTPEQYTLLNLRIAQELGALIPSMKSGESLINSAIVWVQLNNLMNVKFAEDAYVAGTPASDRTTDVLQDQQGFNFMVGFDLKF